MNFKTVFYVLGRIMIIMGLVMILPLLVAFYYSWQGFAEATYSSFLIPIALLVFIGLALKFFFKPKEIKLYAREGLVICGLGWVIVSLFGCLPFIISGAIPDFYAAFFETVSGFTTTGATVLSEIESLPKSILFWRSFTHWIGGMGILSFLIAVVPKSNSNSMYIMKAEVPGPTAGKVTPKISESARTLYIIYTVMTLIQVIVLYVGTRIDGTNMRVFDCVVTSFSTAGTGGYCVMNNSILGYHSRFVEWTCIVFMFMFGINFNLYYYALTKRTKEALRDEELRAYIIISVLFSSIIACNIIKQYNYDWFAAITDSFFAVNSCMTTTGFVTADFDTWPTLSRALILTVMCIGASAGSTGGGIKVSRIVLYAKEITRDLRISTRPNTVLKVRVNRRTVDDKVLRGVNVFLIIYVALIVISTLLVSLDNYSFTATFSAVITCVNNVGPGLNELGPTECFMSVSPFSKIILCIDMLAGRLELFPIITLFSINTWRKAK